MSTVTADTITDEQIRELRQLRAIDAFGAAAALAHGDGREAARRFCAEIYNARHAAEGRPLMHHRRYASGRRTCDLDGQNPTANAPGHEDTNDPTSVDCPMCIADLRARNLLPEAHP